MGQPCQVWILELLITYLGTLEPCVDMHRTVSYIAWSYWGQERSGGTEALQMFFISGPQGKSVTATPGSFCSELGGRAVMLCLSLAIWLKITSLKDSTGTTVHMDCVTWTSWWQSVVLIINNGCNLDFMYRTEHTHTHAGLCNHKKPLYLHS